jgi:hypothetical protein
MASMTARGRRGDLLLRVTLAVPLFYAAFEAAYWSLRQGFHELTLGGQGFADYGRLLLLAVGPTLLFAVGAGFALSGRGGRWAWSIVLACSLAFTAWYFAVLWETFTIVRSIIVPTWELGTYVVPAVYLAPVSVWSIRQAGRGI